MVRKLASAIFVAGALSATQASALGLGELRLNSALNQPLKAQIQLLNVGDLSEDQILVELAGATAFENAGVERNFFLTNLQFSVTLDGKGNGTIEVSTKKLVNEPYLDFVVEARWPAGKLLREYTVLLDLPVYADETSTTVQLSSGDDATASVVLPSAPAPQSASTYTPAQSASKAASTPQSAPTSSTYTAGDYQVRKSETLWRIASNVRPDNSVSVQQTMVALHRANPDAFIDGNINLIKAGAVLRVPEQQEIARVSHRSALQAISQQNNAWRDSRSEAPLEAAAGSAPAPAQPAGPEGRLKLSAAVETDQSNAGTGDSAATGDADTLREELEQSQARLEQTSNENAELKAQIDSLQQELETLRQAVDVESDDMAKLSAAMSKANDSGTEATKADEAETPEAPASQEQAAVTKPEKRVVPAPAVAQKSILDQVLENPLYLGGAAVLLLGLFAIWLKRRSSKSDEFDMAATAHGDLFEEPQAEAEPSISEQEDLVAQSLSEQSVEVHEEPSFDEQEAPAESETGDPIGEADIYVAYGRYQHAADLLSSAISAEPSRSDLRLKLLEVYLESENRDGFREAYVGLQGIGDEQAIGQAKEMLSSVDGASDWLDELELSSGQEEELADFSEQLDTDEFSDDDDLNLAVEDSMADLDFSTTEDDDLDFSESEDLLAEDDERQAELAAELGDFELDIEEDSDVEDSDSGYDAGIDFTTESPLENDLDAGLDDTEESLLTSDDADEDSFEVELEFDTTNDGDDELGLAEESVAPGAGLAGSDDGGLDMELDIELDMGDSDDSRVAGVENAASDAVALDEGLGDLDLQLDEFDSASESTDTGLDTDATQQRDALQDVDEDLDFVAEGDEIATKLDLARAYIDMGDVDGARDILDEVMQEGGDNQKAEASELLSQIS